MVLAPEFCALCRWRIASMEDVVQGIEMVDVTSWGDGVPTFVEGHTAIFHASHWSAEAGQWREVYRGPLIEIRPLAS